MTPPLATRQPRRPLAALLALPLLLAACDRSGTGPAELGAGESTPIVDICVPQLADPSTVRVATDVTYTSPGGQPLRMDIAWPTTGQDHPLVLLIHGGGWTEGDKSDFTDFTVALARLGYTAASVNYRLATPGSGAFPAAVSDVRCAVRWLRANAAAYNARPDRVAALGASAGGHLAGMLGTASTVAALDDGSCETAGDPAVDGVVAMMGPFDLRPPSSFTQEQHDIVATFLGRSPLDDPALAALASPVVHATIGDAPALLLHGTADELVPVGQSRAFRDVLRAAGVPATLIEWPGRGHAFPPEGSVDATRSICTILSFLDRHLRR